MRADRQVLVPEAVVHNTGAIPIPGEAHMTDRLRIGDLAKGTGVSADTIRHYERLGLLPHTTRSKGGYRLFSRSAVDRVLLIRHAVRVGFSLLQLKEFLRVRQAGGAPCLDVRGAAARILDGVEQQIAELTEGRDALRTLLRSWDDRLAHTPRGRPAHLLDALATPPELLRHRPVSNLKRPHRRRA
jgi:DNA-binding transcriptional MerR regulator